MRQSFEEIARLTTQFIRSPVLLLDSMTLFALLKLLTVTATTPNSKSRSPNFQDSDRR